VTRLQVGPRNCSVLHSRQKRFYLFCKLFGPILGPPQPHIQWVMRDHSPGVKCMDMKLTTHLNIVCLELYHLSSICCHSMVLNYAQGHIYHYLYTNSIRLGLFGLPYFVRKDQIMEYRQVLFCAVSFLRSFALLWLDNLHQFSNLRHSCRFKAIWHRLFVVMFVVCRRPAESYITVTSIIYMCGLIVWMI
jgi:hypothetical protein